MIKKCLWSAVAVMIMTASANASTTNSKEFQECMAKAGATGESAIAVCFRDEAKRDMQKIKDAYEMGAQNAALSKWSGSNNMKTGNMRNMFEAWLNFRDMFCAFAAAGNSNYVGSEEYNNAECVYNQTRQHLIDVTVVVQNASSFLISPDEMAAHNPPAQ